jgi:hypothetical protein
MNDAELDRLIAAAAAVSDAEVTAWNLTAPEAHLREEIMSTTDSTGTPATADPAPLVPGPTDEPGGPAPHDRPGADGPLIVDLTREPDARPGRRHRGWRRAVALAAAAAVVLVAVGVVTLASGDSADEVADLASGEGDGGAGRPAVPGAAEESPVPAPTAEDVAVAEGLPTLSLALPDWPMVHVERNPEVPGEGAMTFAPADEAVADAEVTDRGVAAPTGRLELRWGPADLHDRWIDDAEASRGPGAATEVAGEPALTFRADDEATAPTTVVGETAGDPPVSADDPGGDGLQLSTIWVLGDHVVRADGVFPVQAAYDEALAGLEVVPAETWITTLPDDTVLPSQRAAVVDEMLADVPLPDGFDVEPLRSEPEALQSRYHVGAAATGAVTCTWIDRWVDAGAAGDDATVQAAVAAMATSHDWAVLGEMAPDGGWSGVVWEYADALATDAPVSGGRPMTIAESYEQAFGC